MNWLSELFARPPVAWRDLLDVAIVSILISIPLGTLSAVKQDTWIDHSIRAFSIVADYEAGAIDTWAISEGFADEQIFWDDMTWTVAQSRKMFASFLEGDEDLVVQCFEFPDRVGHVFWRIVDPQHPAYDAALAQKWGGALLETLRVGRLAPIPGAEPPSPTGCSGSPRRRCGASRRRSAARPAAWLDRTYRPAALRRKKAPRASAL